MIPHDSGNIYGLFASDAPLDFQHCRYIGQTVKPLSYRLSEHAWATRRGDTVYRARWMRSVWARGAQVLIVPLESVTRDGSGDLGWLLSTKEMLWIAFGHALGLRLTNATLGGEGTLGFRHTPETRAKQSAAALGRPKSEEHRAAMSAARAGEKRGPYSEAHRAAISAAKMGHEVSEEARKKISQNNAQSAKTHCPQGHPYDEINTCHRSRGGRACRTCARDRARRRRAAARAT